MPVFITVKTGRDAASAEALFVLRDAEAADVLLRLLQRRVREEEQRERPLAGRSTREARS